MTSDEHNIEYNFLAVLIAIIGLQTNPDIIMYWFWLIVGVGSAISTVLIKVRIHLKKKIKNMEAGE